jgi:uncharacterized membrane protein
MKFIILTIIVLFPFSTQAALQSKGKNQPLQSFPEATNPVINGNVNTPGNDYNTNQNQIQAQAPSDEQTAQNTEQENIGATPSTVVSSSVPTGNPNLYVILIIVCSVGLIAMLGWLFYRFRIRKE